VTPPLRAIRLFFGVAVFLHWVGRFSWVSCNAFPLCCCGFGGWVVVYWFGSCNAFGLDGLGWGCFALLLGGGVGGNVATFLVF